MQDKIKQVKEKISGFFQKSLKFCGKVYMIIKFNMDFLNLDVLF